MHFDKNKYKVWTWKHPLMLHWVLNPGLVVNELILGQRIPNVSLVEKDTRKPLAERSFVPCPHCHTLHASMKWSPQNKTAFGNWFGLYCDHCGGIIPCLRNLTSALVLLLTFPLWIAFAKGWKARWLNKQKQRFSQPPVLSVPAYNWVKEGLIFGAIMFLIMELVLPLINREGYKTVDLAVGLVIWALSGLLFGFVMKKGVFAGSRSKEPDETRQTA